MSFNIPSPSIGEVFRNHFPFYIPKYQRGYAWEVEEVADFINDIKSLISSEILQDSHFMGGMVQVLVRAANIVSRKHEIVDGQQRMATFTLSAAAIMGGLSALADRSGNADIIGSCESWRAEIQEVFLTYKEAVGASRVDTPKLTLSRTDEAFFRALLRGDTPQPERESHRRLQYAHAAIYDSLVQPVLNGIGSEFDKLQGLLNLYKTVSNRCVVIHVTTEDRKEAYRLFSVLNDRGRNLTDGDLLRARTLELLEGNQIIQDEVERLWDDILDGSADHITAYLKTYFPSITGRRAPSSDLFDNYQAAFLDSPTMTSTKQFVVGLAQDKPAFMAVRQGKWPFTTAPSATAWDKDRLHRLVNILRHEAAHPLLLSAVKLGEQKFIEIVRLLERFVFRYITIVGAHPSPLYKPYNAQAKKIRDNLSAYQERSLQTELAMLIKDRAPDTAFEANLFARLEYSDNSTRNREIRHFLTTLESYRRWYERLPRNRRKPTPDTMNVYDVAATTLEHIYPNSAPSGQQDAAMELLKQQLPNLSIMAGADNVAAENASFGVKRAEYAQSGIGLTRRLSNFPTWTHTEFMVRRQELTRMALAVFGID